MRKNICKRNIAIFMAATMVLSPVSSTFDNYSISNLVSVKADDLEDFIVNGRTLLNYEGKGGDVVIPDGVTRIEEHAFLNCSELKSLTIPKSVTYIDATAFGGCNNLTSITLSEGISEVNPRFFSGCVALTAIHVSDNDPNYCSVDGVVFNKNKTELIVCPRGKKGEYVIPEGVKVLGFAAFEKCSGLTEVTIPEGITRIEGYTFSGCFDLKSVTIPESVVHIGECAFDSCRRLTEVKLPESVKEIGNSAFGHCYSLKSVTLPDSARVSEYAFVSCSSLEGIYVSENNPNYCSVDGVLYSKDKTRLIKCPGTKLGEFVVPEGVTEVGPLTFTGCKYITSIRIPETVTQLNSLELWSCTSLSRIYIPESVTTIKGTMDSNGENCIISEKQNVKIYSPSGSAAETYSNRYDNLIFVDGEMPANIPGDINGDGDVNSDDVYALRRYLAGDNVNVIKENLDVNGDGKVNSKDSTRLMQYVARFGVSIH